LTGKVYGHLYSALQEPYKPAIFLTSRSLSTSASTTAMRKEIISFCILNSKMS